MEKKSVIKKITGSRGSAGNYRNRAVCSCHSDQPVIPYAEVTHGDAEK